jgi:hypothetical protein
MPVYPTSPKSARTLVPGEYWGVPLKDGSYACGRVLQAAASYPGASTVIFFGALLNWRGYELPTSNTIAGAEAIAQGKIHIKSLKTFGTSILGCRSLDLDGIVPTLVRSGLGDPEGMVMLGVMPLRPQTNADAELPPQSLWGVGYIRALAEHRFLQDEA